MKTPLQTAIAEALENPDCFVTPNDARNYRDDLKQLAKDISDLASYCEAKGNAMECRLRGNIATAKRFEEACETVYQRLPAFLRW